jgi:hypothetical protein
MLWRCCGGARALGTGFGVVSKKPPTAFPFLRPHGREHSALSVCSATFALRARPRPATRQARRPRPTGSSTARPAAQQASKARGTGVRIGAASGRARCSAPRLSIPHLAADRGAGPARRARGRAQPCGVREATTTSTWRPSTPPAPASPTPAAPQRRDGARGERPPGGCAQPRHQPPATLPRPSALITASARRAPARRPMARLASFRRCGSAWRASASSSPPSCGGPSSWRSSARARPWVPRPARPRARHRRRLTGRT